jgi:hypothetical protein
MSMWEKLSDSLCNDSKLGALGEAQVEIIIEVLACMVHADGQVAFMERAKFRGQLLTLPWVADKAAIGDAHLEAAVDAARQTDFGELSARAGGLLTDGSVRDKVYRMALAMAWADSELHDRESALLADLATAFEIADPPTTV